MGSKKQELLQFFIYLNDNGQLVLFVLFLNWIFYSVYWKKKGRKEQNPTNKTVVAF